MVRTTLEEPTTPDWKNCSTNDASESRAATIERWTARILRVPDMCLEIKEILVSGSIIIVRGEATGTPSGPFMGVEPAGHSFWLMTLDIHEVEDGLVSRTYHVEDWGRALRQHRGEPG